MKLSYNWLNEYIEHGYSPEGLGDALTMAGLELEEIEHLGASLKGVVVGHVLETRAHPNADRLTLCDVDLGAGEPVQIACGATNVAAGQKVPVAPVGTTLMLPKRDDPAEKEPVTLQKIKLRGEVSNGMICSEDELGLSADHSAIMILADEAEVGRPFVDYLKARGVTPNDAVLDIAITPNRPDATSHLGVARDVAALTGNPLRRPDVTLPDAGGQAAEQVSVEIECPEACHRYVALLVRGIEIKESPAWLKQRLTAVGLRPRNNVVDVTNYVMHECGQPLHAFDYDQLAGHTVIVRQAEGGEAFTTLDSKEHRLPEGTVMICDAERFVAIGGIMGGENSEVTDATTNVLIESAWFDPSVTRKAAKELGIMSDASYRFERGVDPAGQAWAAARAAQLMVEVGGGEIVPGMVDAHPTPPRKAVVPLRLSRIERVMGMPVPEEEAVRILAALGFEVTKNENATLHCTVPTYRPDVEREIDVIEEVARIVGFDNIPEPSHTLLPNQTPRERPEAVLRDTAGALLTGRGYFELYTNSLLSHEEAERFNLEILSGGEAGSVVGTLNAISQEMSTLRPSLLPGALQVMSFNQKHGRDALRFFEFGHVFHRTDSEDVLVSGYAEHEAFLLATSGPAAPMAFDRDSVSVDFFDLKGDVESLLETLHVPEVTMAPAYDATTATAYHLEVASGEVHLGVIARLADNLADELDMKAPVFFAELNWTRLVQVAAPHLERNYEPVSRFPVVNRDLAVVVRRDEPAGAMLATIRAAGQPLLRAVAVFDLYEGEHIDAGRKSIAFALRFGADRTLKDEEVDHQVTAILNQLERRHEATLRS